MEWKGSGEAVRRVGLLVSAFNTTLEHELAEIVRATEKSGPTAVSFHSSRMNVRRPAEELCDLSVDVEQCTLALSAACIDAMVYGNLLGSMRHGSPRSIERQLQELLRREDGVPHAISCASSMVDGLHAIGAKRVAVISPYSASINQVFIDYLANEGIIVADTRTLGMSDGKEIGRLNPRAPVALSQELMLSGVDAIVASACVQMPSLNAIEEIERRTGIPTVSGTSCTAYALLKRLGRPTKASGLGTLFSDSLR